MNCPHCTIAFHASWNPWTLLGNEQRNQVQARMCTCPQCARAVVELAAFGQDESELKPRRRVYPSAITRVVPPEVTTPYSTDYKEAAEVLPISPKASAALSRRNVQAILQDKARVTGDNLHSQIGEILARPDVPQSIKDTIDMVRHVGNLAAHPIKSTHTGEIVEVELHEAEALLEVLDSLFDFYFVLPAKNASRRDALNVKLAAANKPAVRTGVTQPNTP